MVKTLPDNELKAVGNPFWQYKFASGDLKPNEWQLSGIDVSGDLYISLRLAISSTRFSIVNQANSLLSLRSVTIRSATAVTTTQASLP